MSEYRKYKMIIIIMATALLFGIGIVVSWKLVRSLSKLEEGYDTDVKMSLFWSFIMVLGFTNTVEILLLEVYYFTPYEMKSTVPHIIKNLVIVFTGTVGAAVGYISVEMKSPRNSNKQGISCCSLSLSGPVEYGCALCNLFLFVFFISISIITTIAMLMVHPILILSTISYISTCMFSLIVLFAIPNSFGLIANRWIANRNSHSEFRKCYLYLCNGLLYTISMIALDLIALLYLMTLSKVDYAYNNANILQDISSFLPSIIPAVVGYFANKKLTARSKKRFKEASSVDDSEEFELASLEEKTNLGASPLTLVEGDRESAASDNDNETTKLLLPATEETEL